VNRCSRTWVKWLWLLVCLAWMWTAAAELQAGQAQQKSCLWSLQTGSTTLFLLGSIHLLTADAYPLAPAIEQAYQTSRLVVFETDLAAFQDAAVQTRMIDLAKYPQGQSLFQNIALSTRRLLEKKLAPLGLPLESFAPFRPWFVAINLEVLEAQKMGFDPAYGVDLHFYAQAKHDAKQTAFLETPEEQLAIFAKMSPRDQNAFLDQTLQELDLMGELTSELIRYWRNGDTRRLHALLSKSFQKHPALYQRIIIERNKRWSEQIARMIGQHRNIMVVVGAGHLVGPDSIVEMLRRKGYQPIQR
jgi:uncharacterized protein YbaP (TraB family)